MRREVILKTYCRIMHDYQNIGVLRHLVKHGREIMEFHFEGMKFFTDTGTGMLERLDKFGGSFVSCWVQLVGVYVVR